MGYSRNVNPDIASELGDYSEWKLITLVSPDGENFTIRRPAGVGNPQKTRGLAAAFAAWHLVRGPVPCGVSQVCNVAVPL